MIELWNEIAGRAGVALSHLQTAQLDRYITLLLEANKRMNLTRIPDRATADVAHVADALTVLPHLPAGAHRLADVGSGGGVPGLVLASARPDAQVFLIESTKKKAEFLRETAAALDLANVTVIADRAEAAGRGELRDSCDVVIARAVAAMTFLAEWCLPLVKKGGKFLAMKGAKIAEELPEAQTAIRLLSGAPAVVHPVELPGTEHHVIVEVVKIGRTPLDYPRDPTVAKGKAIGA
ncbi:MAG TPA: 16S rRNA (guanine(527)-N(7))-methyltransferase RsmG [Tepidisphaeraceae bacterium]|nr:16S rRNA (guanine(527)-N(7))-methyltransferase RsmG [Tepidisphaeraceae bacterium]